MQTGRLFIK